MTVPHILSNNNVLPVGLPILISSGRRLSAVNNGFFSHASDCTTELLEVVRYSSLKALLALFLASWAVKTAKAFAIIHRIHDNAR